MSLFENMPLTAQEEMFNRVNDNLMDKLISLTIDCNIDIDDLGLEFKDPDFLKNFFQMFSNEEQKKYALASYNFKYGKDYDQNYLLVFRRAIYTEYAKNENFWSTDFNQPRFGLKKEQPLGSPVRLYSSIMVSTMEKLKKHGLADLEHGGATDGEIVIDATKPFDDFLFVYKPSDEFVSLNQYISSGGMSYDEIVDYLRETSEERKYTQGFRR